MLAAALAEQIRGGILLLISGAIAVFFFLDASVNIFGRKRDRNKTEEMTHTDTIIFRVKYGNKIRGEDVFLPLEPEQKIRVGFGVDCDLDLSRFPLPEKGEDGIWFVVQKNSAGVLMVMKDPTMNGLKVRGPQDKEYKSLGRELLRDRLAVELDGIEIRVEKELE